MNNKNAWYVHKNNSSYLNCYKMKKENQYFFFT